MNLQDAISQVEEQLLEMYKDIKLSDEYTMVNVTIEPKGVKLNLKDSENFGHIEHITVNRYSNEVECVNNKIIKDDEARKLAEDLVLLFEKQDSELDEINLEQVQKFINDRTNWISPREMIGKVYEQETEHYIQYALVLNVIEEKGKDVELRVLTFSPRVKDVDNIERYGFETVIIYLDELGKCVGELKLPEFLKDENLYFREGD